MGKFKGIHWTKMPNAEEIRKKISKNRKGKCAGENNPFYGKKHSKENKEKISKAVKKAWEEKPEVYDRAKELARERMKGNTRGFKKGDEPWNKGIEWERMKTEKHPGWKGDEATYGVIHKWVYRNFGRATKCELCGATDKEKRICWANKSHNYKRELTDWMQLCYKCHWHYDKD